jgi:hypothetical protein
MLNAVLDVLSALGVLPVLQFVAVSIAAIYIYRYFVDKG